MFTDSVQDAAHRAGFVQARSHSLTLRTALRSALGDGELDLDELSQAVIARAGNDPMLRYQLLPPDIVDRDEFVAFWQADAHANSRRAAENKAKRRLRFDVDLEFGLQSRTGRTLELTGSVAAEVYLGAPHDGADPRAACTRARRRHAAVADRGLRRGAGPLGARHGGTGPHPRRHPPRVAAAVRGEERQPLPRLGRSAARPGHARLPERPSCTGLPGAEVRNRCAARGIRPDHRAHRPGTPGGRRDAWTSARTTAPSWPRRCSPNSPSRCCCPRVTTETGSTVYGLAPGTVHVSAPTVDGTARRAAPAGVRRLPDARAG